MSTEAWILIIIGVITAFAGIYFPIRSERKQKEAERIAQEEAKRKAEEEAKRKSEEEAKRKAEEEKKEEERKRKEEEERKRKEEEERKRKEEEEKNKGGITKLRSGFSASVRYFYPGKYVVSVDYSGDDGIFITVTLQEKDICKLVNQNELRNLYLEKGGSFAIQLERAAYNEEKNSCVFIKWESKGAHTETIMFDVNTCIIESKLPQ